MATNALTGTSLKLLLRPQKMTALAQAETAAKEQCHAAQQEAEGYLAALEAQQQQDGVLKDEIARVTAELERVHGEADAIRAEMARAEEEAVRLSETVQAKEAEIETLQAQVQEAGMQLFCLAVSSTTAVVEPPPAGNLLHPSIYRCTADRSRR